MATRSLYMVLSSRSLPYGKYAMESLCRRAAEAFQLHLVTDSEDDGAALNDFLRTLSATQGQSFSVHTPAELNERESALFRHYPKLRAFRKGHPCWRKITDPMLLSPDGAEMILLDPDIFFPNRFTFEETPASGLLLMWQRPNCLFPPSVVRAALEAGIRLAHHVDIGVAQWRNAVDVDWLEWLVGSLGKDPLPRVMHIEAIVWSAIAMKVGGGYLDPRLWHCWHRTQTKRVQRLLHASGAGILKAEPWNEMKCFHAGGEAKWWIPEACDAGFPHAASDRTQPGKILPFVELTPVRYGREQSIKRLLRGMGYYRLFRAA